MAITKEDIDRLAVLARLDVSAAEEKKMEEDLSSILAYVDRLQQIDTVGVAEAGTAAAESLRKDEAVSVDEPTHELILNNFPDRKGDALQVPAVFDNPKH
ncbi:MAG: Asp-tRNA(Asn)/Glu-tRNA(Gln) amidotransferase subunit GatC [bacterium]|nr:Asp-tRNA(Asn)/Glu-tRNA(Gln) amidotransferase subunit GatC [bacterium]